MSNNDLILVTGASGYVALHVIDVFLKEGFRVRGTVRSLKDENKIDAIKRLEQNGKYSLELVEADLLDADSWKEPLKDVSILIHVASPFPHSQPDDEQTIIRPALDGTLNVLNAAFNANVKRVVLTSSLVTICGYDRVDNKTYSEADWANEKEMKIVYGKSKVLAERAAWNFVEEKKKNNENCFELSVINPSFVLGPSLHSNSFSIGTSEIRILNILEAKVEKVMNLYLGVCDVRDVARAHFIAAFLPEAIGHRHLISSLEHMVSLKTFADILNEEFGKKGYKIPTEEEPGPNNGKLSKIDISRMRNVLKIEPTDLRKTLIDMANSLIESGIAKPKLIA